LLVKELNYVSEQMLKNVNPDTKLYYYSAAYGIVLRIYNLEYNPELLFIQHILNTTYNTLYQQFKSQELSFDIPEGIPDKIAILLKELSNNIKNDKDIYLPLQKITNLVYISTGNGYYLYKKGLIEL